MMRRLPDRLPNELPTHVVEGEVIEEENLPSKVKTPYLLSLGNIHLELTPLTTIVLGVVALGLGFLAVKAIEVLALAVIVLILLRFLTGSSGKDDE